MNKSEAKAVAQVKPLVSVQTATIALVALIGVAVISVTGHVQATTLHDAAHDVRHATGFPCH